MPPISLDLVGAIIGFLITIMILSYLIGDNPLYRIASYIFVGASAGYIASVAFWYVLMPRLIVPFRDGDTLTRTWLTFPLLFSTLIMMKISPRLSRLASPAMGYLVGVGAALSIAGALNGTILPQFFSGINMFDVGAARAQNMGFIEMITNGGIAIAGTITTLIYFQFSAKRTQDGSIKRAGLIEILAWVGGIFIAITLGVIFAGVLSTAMTALIERLNSVLTFIFSLIGPA